MGPYDEETERYLKEFRPQSICELEIGPHHGYIFWRRLAAAAAVAISAGGLLWLSHRESTPLNPTKNIQEPNAGVASQGPHRTALALTLLALTDNERFETLLAEESRKSLPRFQGKESAMKVLAKD